MLPSTRFQTRRVSFAAQRAFISLSTRTVPGKRKKKETNVIGVRLRRSDYLPPIQLSASSEHRTDNLRPLPPISGESPTPKRVPRGYVDCPSSGS